MQANCVYYKVLCGYLLGISITSVNADLASNASAIVITSLIPSCNQCSNIVAVIVGFFERSSLARNSFFSAEEMPWRGQDRDNLVVDVALLFA